MLGKAFRLERANDQRVQNLVRHLLHDGNRTKTIPSLLLEKNKATQMPGFAAIMTRDHFKSVLRFLHFVNKNSSLMVAATI